MDDKDMRQLVEQTNVTAEKIRILFDAGVSRSDIARFLEIRYQHVHNVLKRSNRLSTQNPPTEPCRSIIQVQVEKGGRITLPKEYVDAQQIREGDLLICRDEGGNLMIMSRAAAIELVRDIARQRMPEEAKLLEALLSGPNIGN